MSEPRYHFATPANNWDAQVWRSSFSTFLDKHQSIAGVHAIDAFIQLCIKKFSAHGCKESIGHLQIVRKVVNSSAESINSFSLSDLEISLDFLSLINAYELCAADDLVTNVRGACERFNICPVHDSGNGLKLEILRVSGLPFDYCECKAIVYFNAKWYLLAKALWKSEDGRSWEKVELPDMLWMDGMKVVGSNLVVVGKKGGVGGFFASSDCFVYTVDGCAWKMADLPKCNGLCYKFELFSGCGEFIAVAYSSKKYSFEEDGLLWGKNSKTASCNATTIWTTSALSAADGWVEESVRSLDEGLFLDDNSFFAGECFNVALLSVDSSYARNMKKSMGHARLIHSYAKGPWSDADVSSGGFCYERNNKSVPEERLAAKFCLFSDKIICSVADYGMYLSGDCGAQWMPCDGDVDKNLCDFCANGDYVIAYRPGQNEVRISTDGKSFQSMKLSQCLDICAMNDEKMIFLDKDSKCGGLFYAEID